MLVRTGPVTERPAGADLAYLDRHLQGASEPVTPLPRDSVVVEGEWLARYLAGEQDQVWHELRQLGGRVRRERYFGAAQGVCDEMARRCRHNIEVIVDRLQADGFRFHSNDDDQRPVASFLPATGQAAERAAVLEHRFGPLPMTVSSWIRIVGDVWFVGSHPAWASASAADPLVIQLEGSHYPDNDIINEYFTEEYSMWSEDGARGLFKLPVAPDRLHKDNTSGGGPYGVVLPDSCADGLLVLDTLTVSFVDYLRWVFGSGGFPADTGDHAAQWRVRQRLTADLLRI